MSGEHSTVAVRARRHPVVALVVVLTVLLAALLLLSAPASALSQRGHVFSFAFGSEGQAAGHFAHPSGIAVNDSTGVVYVADRYNNRVQEFKPETVAGKLVSETYAAEFGVPDPQYVAVDDSCFLNGKSGAECASLYPSNGDVYVVGARSVRDVSELEEEAAELKAAEVELKAEAKQLKAEAKQLKKEAEKLTGAAREATEKEAREKESQEAKAIGAAEEMNDKATEARERAKEAAKKLLPGEKTEEQEEVEAEAADPEHFWVYKFSPDGTPITRIREFKHGKIIEEFAEEEEDLEGVAVDTSGSLFVYQRDGRIYAFNDAADKNQLESVWHSSLSEEGKPGLATDSQDNLYVGVVSGGEELEGIPGFEETDGKTMVERLKEFVEEVAKLSSEAKQLRLEAESLTGAEEEAKIKQAQEKEARQREVVQLQEEPEEARHEALEELEGLLAEIASEYDGHTGEELATVAKLEHGTGRVLDPALDFEDFANTTAVAVNPKDVPGDDVDELDDLYLDNVTFTGGEETGTVSAYSPAGKLIQSFSAPGLRDADGVAVDAATGAVYVADVGSDEVDVFTLEEPDAPKVEPGSLSSPLVTSSSAELRAMIDPRDPEGETSYSFQYGTGHCSSSSSCTTVPAQPEQGQGFGDQAVSVKLSGLSPSTTYHFRAIAENGHGGAAGEEQAFTTGPSTVAAASLLDGREWELVSPASKYGALIEPISELGGLVEAAPDGDAIAYMTSAPIGRERRVGYRGQENSQVISTRLGSADWSSEDIATPNELPHGIHAGEAREYKAFSPDLSLSLVLTREPLPSSETTEPTTEPTLYLRDNETCAATPQTCYRPLARAMGTSETGHVEFLDATTDLRHVVFAYSGGQPLIPGTAGPGLYEWSEEEVHPSEWSEGHLTLVSVLENGKQASGAVSLGNREIGSRNAISEDGSRVVWETDGDLYMRDTIGQGETLLINEPHKEGPPPGPGSPIYQTASVSGSKAFFTDPQRLTEDAPLNGGGESLYVFESEKPKGERVTDLTPVVNSGESADVLYGVLGASNAGSYIYVVANGILSPEAKRRGHCSAGSESAPAATCNLYVVHYNGERWEEPRFIAELSASDAPDWGASGVTDYVLGRLTSRVSPDGEYLAFMSDRSLTGYDNEDVTSKKEGERLDEEVYLYHYGGNEGHGQLVCASCNPSGARPVGMDDTEYAGEGNGPLVDRAQTWRQDRDLGVDHWLAASVPGWTGLAEQGYNPVYQSRYLSNKGRLFFDSADALVALEKPTRKETIGGEEEEVGVENVYEYEPTGVGSCESESTAGGCVALISSGTSEKESAFLDASENGDDVFFVTTAPLSPLDTDQSYDIYDARVCTQAPGPEQCPGAPSQPSPCSGEACRPAQFPHPTHEAPSSSTLSVSGPGNILQQTVVLGTNSRQKPKPLTRAQKLTAALKGCKKDKKKSKRVSCEKQAREKYASKSSKKAPAANKSSTKRGSKARSSSRTTR